MGFFVFIIIVLLFSSLDSYQRTKNNKTTKCYSIYKKSNYSKSYDQKNTFSNGCQNGQNKEPVDLSLNIFDEEEIKIIRVDWSLFKDILKDKNISCFYHITDESNIKSIGNCGSLFSRKYCNQNNISINSPGGNDLSASLDKYKNLDDYVRLSFTSNQPMLYIAKKEGRIKNPKIIKIDPRIIYLKTTKFSNMNAADKRATVSGSLELFQKIRFDIMKKQRWENEYEKKAFQAEILVKTKINKKFFKSII